MVCSFLSNDKIYFYISNKDKNLTPYGIAIGEESINFSTPDFEFIKREKMENFELMETNEKFVDLFDYHVSNCEKDSFK